MTQTVLIEHFAKYYDFAYASHIEQAENQLKALSQDDANANNIQLLRNNIEELKKERANFIKELTDNDGLCHGFALCHAAMDQVGKLDWWEEALIEFNNWDGKQESLQTVIDLKDAEPNQPVTRGAIFERIINYVLFYHADASDSYRHFLPSDMHQHNILFPANNDTHSKSHFSVIDKHGNELFIKNQINVSGNFDNEMLSNILIEDNFQDTICLIESLSHTIRIKYDGKNWLVYDANDDHSHKQTIHFVGTKKDIIEKIYSSLETRSFSIRIAVLNENKAINFAYYDALFDGDKIELIHLLKDDGIYQIASIRPDLLQKILLLAVNSPLANEIRKSISLALKRHYVDNDNLLLMITTIPKGIENLLKLADNTPDGKELRSALAEALLVKPKDRLPVIFQIFDYTKSPVVMAQLLKLADNTPEGKKIRSAISTSLFDKSINPPFTTQILISMMSVPMNGLNFTDTNNMNLLHIAAKLGKRGVVKALIDQKIDLNVIDKFNETALRYALKNGDIATINSLIDNGAAITSEEDIFIIIRLINNGNDIHIKNLSPSTFRLDTFRRKMNSLHNVSTAIEDDIKMLTQHLTKDEINEPIGLNGDTAIHLATQYSAYKTIQTLCEAGADINAKNVTGETPLDIAARIKNFDIIKLLVLSGANVPLKKPIELPDKTNKHYPSSILLVFHQYFYDKIAARPEKFKDCYKLILEATNNDNAESLLTGFMRFDKLITSLESLQQPHVYNPHGNVKRIKALQELRFAIDSAIDNIRLNPENILDATINLARDVLLIAEVSQLDHEVSSSLSFFKNSQLYNKITAILSDHKDIMALTSSPTNRDNKTLS